jgi:hypothetical protein
MLKKIDGEWALVSKTNPDKILKWFGKKKPSDEEVAKEERRVNYFKHLSQECYLKLITPLLEEVKLYFSPKECKYLENAIYSNSKDVLYVLFEGRGFNPSFEQLLDIQRRYNALVDKTGKLRYTEDIASDLSQMLTKFLLGTKSAAQKKLDAIKDKLEKINDDIKELEDLVSELK